MTTYQVNEIFYSLQGEGMHVGTPAVFIRLAGCSMNCSFCDTDYSTNMELTPEQILTEVKLLTTQCTTIILTGGEPTDQDLFDLTVKLKRNGYTIHLETNGQGSYPIPYAVDWITISPKTTDILGSFKLLAHEAKFLYPTTFSKEFMLGFNMPRFIQPIDDDNYTENLKNAITFCLTTPGFRLSLQTHKLIGVK